MFIRLNYSNIFIMNFVTINSSQLPILLIIDLKKIEQGVGEEWVFDFSGFGPNLEIVFYF